MYWSLQSMPISGQLSIYPIPTTHTLWHGGTKATVKQNQRKRKKRKENTGRLWLENLHSLPVVYYRRITGQPVIHAGVGMNPSTIHGACPVLSSVRWEETQQLFDKMQMKAEEGKRDQKTAWNRPRPERKSINWTVSLECYSMLNVMTWVKHCS